MEDVKKKYEKKKQKKTKRVNKNKVKVIMFAYGFICVCMADTYSHLESDNTLKTKRTMYICLNVMRDDTESERA